MTWLPGEAAPHQHIADQQRAAALDAERADRARWAPADSQKVLPRLVAGLHYDVVERQEP